MVPQLTLPPVLLLEAIVRHEPMLTLFITKEFGTGHEEYAPALQPQSGIGRPVHLLEQSFYRSFVLVHVGQPGLRGPLIVVSRILPLTFDGKVILEMQQGVAGGHKAAAEEVSAHPIVVALGLERVS